MPEQPKVQLVILDTGLFKAYVDWPDMADQVARENGGVVIEVPIKADYRRSPS